MKTCSIVGCDRKHQARGYCGAHYNSILIPDRHVTNIVCVECGETYTTTRTNGQYCSLWCRDAQGRRDGVVRIAERKALRMATPRVDLRSPLRRAVQDGAAADVILAAIRALCDVGEDGCWNWTRALEDGYPILQWKRPAGGMHRVRVHRLSLETHTGQTLGSQPAHHVCANTKCVNPEHLQAVSHADNTAEMLSRTYMLRRIADLEAVVRLVSPGHPLLLEIGVPVAA